MNRKLVITVGVVLLIFLGGVVIWSIGQTTKIPQPNSKGSIANSQSSQPANTTGATQTDQQGAVEVAITWVDPSLSNTTLKFDVAMNTHSVNLDDYNLVQNVEVYVDNQKINSQPALTKEGSGHHVQNILSVPNLNLAQAKFVKLILKNLDNIPQRTFSWDIKGLGLK